MARRNDIDWEHIERLYVAGQLTVQQIADEAGVATSSVKLKAKQRGWKQDLTAAIAARSQAKISQIDVAALIEQSASQSANQSAKTIQSAIEQASDVAAGIVIKHRSSIRLEQDRAQAIESLLDERMSSATEIRDLSTIAQTYKMLVDAKSKLRDQERVIFGLDSHKGNDSAPIARIELVALT